jgi:copper chaperone
MEILVFKTNIRLKKDLKVVEPLLNKNDSILRWNVDRADADRVLRVVTSANISCELQNQLTQAGYICEELPD